MLSGGRADICMILEGTYPYVTGGVSNWMHELINRHSDKTFHLLAILPPQAKAELKYDLPRNVTGVTNFYLQKMEKGTIFPGLSDMLAELEGPLTALTSTTGGLKDFQKLLDILGRYRGRIGSDALLNSEEAWELIQRMYEKYFEESSYLDYFWSWRALMGSLFTMAVEELPQANVYHAVSTGYAGMLAARAKIETGRPVLLTEHGIYTNERRIEVASADWLEETSSKSLTIDHVRNNLRDFWSNGFASFSRTCYEACDEIITLYEGNQQMQIADGADPRKMRIIPNGVDIQRFDAIKAEAHDRPTVALIGRVVPIKDIKSFIRAMGIVAERIPDVEVLIMGPTDEDIEYYQECRQMVEYMGLNSTINFTGKVNIDNYLPRIDVTVLSSISEAMPLTLLEAGACGIPSVTTDVGACREILLGTKAERPSLGDGGAIVSLSNPTQMAEQVVKLLTDGEHYRACSETIRKRVSTYYNKEDQISAYNGLYGLYLNQKTQRKAS